MQVALTDELWEDSKVLRDYHDISIHFISIFTFQLYKNLTRNVHRHRDTLLYD